MATFAGTSMSGPGLWGFVAKMRICLCLPPCLSSVFWRINTGVDFLRVRWTSTFVLLLRNLRDRWCSWAGLGKIPQCIVHTCVPPCCACSFRRHLQTSYPSLRKPPGQSDTRWRARNTRILKRTSVTIHFLSWTIISRSSVETSKSEKKSRS